MYCTVVYVYMRLGRKLAFYIFEELRIAFAAVAH